MLLFIYDPLAKDSAGVLKYDTLAKQISQAKTDAKNKAGIDLTQAQNNQISFANETILNIIGRPGFSYSDFNLLTDSAKNYAETAFFRLAEFWYHKGLYTEGTTYSISTQTSITKTDPRRAGYVPKEIYGMLELAGLYSYQSVSGITSNQLSPDESKSIYDSLNNTKNQMINDLKGLILQEFNTGKYKGATGDTGPQGITDGYETPGITPQKDDFSVKIGGKSGGVSKSNIFIADTGNIFFDTAPITDAGKVDTPQIKINGVGDAALKGKEPLWDNNIIWWELLKRKLLSKAEKDAVYNKAEVDTKLALKADKATIYTKTETDNKLAANAKVVRALADWFINNFSTLKTDLLAKIATKNDLIKINLDTLKNVNGVLFKNWKLSTQLTDFQNLFIPGKDYELIWETEKYWVKATHLSNTYWHLTGFQNNPQNPEGFGYIYFYINSNLSNGIFNIVNLRNLKAVENQFKYQYDGLNSFLNILNFLEIAQTKKRLANYPRETATFASVGVNFGIKYEKLSNSKVKVRGNRIHWVKNTTPPVFNANSLELKAYYNWDWSAITNRNEKNEIAGLSAPKRFYKGDKLIIDCHIHLKDFGRHGLFLVFKHNGVKLKVSDSKVLNRWNVGNSLRAEWMRNQTLTDCDNLSIGQWNPVAAGGNKYFNATIEVRFEDSGIFIETKGGLDNGNDINDTETKAVIKYPSNYDDNIGIEFSSIDCWRTNFATGTISNSLGYYMLKGSEITIYESPYNKQLKAVDDGVVF